MRPDDTPAPAIRIGYVVSRYPAVNLTFVLNEILQLRLQGFDIDVVSIRYCDRPANRLSPDENLEFQRVFYVLNSGTGRIAASHLRALVRSPFGYCRAALYAVRLGGGNARGWLLHLAYFAEAVVAGDHLWRRGVRHIHTHAASTVSLILTRLYPVTFSMTVHGPDEFNDPAGFHLGDKVANALFVCAVSSFAASQLMRWSDPYHWAKIRVEYLGVDCVKFSPGWVNDSKEMIRILCVGRLVPEKAQHLLISSVKHLLDSGRVNIRLVLIGEGPSRRGLEDKIREFGLADYVTLAGACHTDEVRKFYRDTEIFALPSFAEGIPVVLMEAMAAGLPCVTTWIAGIPELIRADIDGLLIEPGDEIALTNALARLIDDSELRARLGASAQVRVKEKFDLTINTEKFGGAFLKYLRPEVNLNQDRMPLQPRPNGT